MADYRGKKIFLALCAGAAMALSMPGLGMGPLVFIALLPLFLALEGGRPFQTGFIVGVVFFALDLRWLLTLYRFSPLVVPGYLFLSLYLATYLGLFGLLVHHLGMKRKRSWTLLILAPVSYTLLEILRAHGPLGIGFSALYQTLFRFPQLIQITALAGPWALSAAIVVVNTALYLTLRRHLLYLVPSLGVIGLLATCSLIPAPKGGTPINVAVVSSEVSQDIKLDTQNLTSLARHYISLGEEAASSKPDLIVFPESILPTYILLSPQILGEFTALAQRMEARVLFGTGDLRNHRIYNSVVLISPEGTLVGQYDMVHPVPFGEIIPARKVLERIGFAPLISSFLPQEVTPGERFTPIAGIGTPICFESTFPSPARAFARDGAWLLVTVTNDAWFARSSELWTHFAAAVFRAVETQRYVIQAANSGVSGILDPRGRILQQTLSEGLLVGEVTPQIRQTPYTRWGDIPLYVVFSLGSLFLVLKRKKIDKNR
jgi:apolipoprotein N-acyltransferase